MSMSYANQLALQIIPPSVARWSVSAARKDNNNFRDRVAAINLRILIGDVFRSLYSQQDSYTAALRMELECTWIAWFPQRLQQILEKLVSNSILSSNRRPDGRRVSVYFRRLYPGYELRVTDNTEEANANIVESTQTDSIVRHNCGLNAVRTLLEESDGELMVRGNKGHGTIAIAKLPCYCMGDFLEGSLPT